jgi:hypothetical protein
MPDSWRNILERAAANLSIELDPNAQPVLKQQPAGWPAQRRHHSRPTPPRETRDMLAKELEAISKPQERRLPASQRAKNYPVAVYRPPITQAVRQPAKPSPQSAAAKSAARELAALSISVAIVVLAIYGFLFLLR